MPTSRPTPGAPAAGGGEASFADKRAFLESGAAWPGEPPPICQETHASIVCLTRDRAWKLKKPVHLMHVDQRSLASRERYCREELRLNREMSGAVYRGLMALVQRPDGTLSLGGAGRIVDWVIETQRLPATEMLDSRLATGRAPVPAEIDALADVLIGFYRGRAPLRDAADVFLRRLQRDSRIGCTHLREMAPKVGVDLPGPVLRYAEMAVADCGPEIAARDKAGLLIEGHGDLRAEHVCLTQPPVLFDRLEIDHGLRILDPFFEVNALALECGLRGAGWIGTQLMARLGSAFTPPGPRLMTVYGVIACVTRARFALDHFRDSAVPTPEKWVTRANEYLAAAAGLIDATQPA